MRRRRRQESPKRATTRDAGDAATARRRGRSRRKDRGRARPEAEAWYHQVPPIFEEPVAADGPPPDGAPSGTEPGPSRSAEPAAESAPAPTEAPEGARSDEAYTDESYVGEARTYGAVPPATPPPMARTAPAMGAAGFAQPAGGEQDAAAFHEPDAAVGEPPEAVAAAQATEALPAEDLASEAEHAAPLADAAVDEAAPVDEAAVEEAAPVEAPEPPEQAAPQRPFVHDAEASPALDPPMIIPIRAYYMTRADDTLRSIAAQFLNTPSRWQELRSLNAGYPGIADAGPDSVLAVGSSIALPGDPLPWGKPDPVYLWTLAEKFLFAAWGREPSPDEVVPFWRGLTSGAQHLEEGPSAPAAISEAAAAPVEPPIPAAMQPPPEPPAPVAAPPAEPAPEPPSVEPAAAEPAPQPPAAQPPAAQPAPEPPPVAAPPVAGPGPAPPAEPAPEPPVDGDLPPAAAEPPPAYEPPPAPEAPPVPAYEAPPPVEPPRAAAPPPAPPAPEAPPAPAYEAPPPVEPPRAEPLPPPPSYEAPPAVEPPRAEPPPPPPAYEAPPAPAPEAPPAPAYEAPPVPPAFEAPPAPPAAPEPADEPPAAHSQPPAGPEAGPVRTAEPAESEADTQLPAFMPSLTGTAPSSDVPLDHVAGATAPRRVLAGTALGDAMLLWQLGKLRRRRPKAPESVPHPVELSLQQTARMDSLRLIEAAMRQLRAVTIAQFKPKPSVVCVRTGSYGFEVLLDQPVEVPEGWQAASGGYVLELRREVTLEQLDAAGQGPSLCPALVPVGDTAEGPLLLNLEEIGCLAVSGPADASASLLASVVEMLGSSPLAGSVRIITVGVSAPSGPGWERIHATSFDSPRLEHLLTAAHSPAYAGSDATLDVLVVGPGNDILFQRAGQIASSPGSRLVLVGATSSPGTRWPWRIQMDELHRAVVHPIAVNITATRAMTPELSYLLSEAAEGPQAAPRL